MAAVSLALAAGGMAQDTARLAAEVKAQAEGDGFMGSVLVAQHDRVVFEASAGWANAEWKIPNSATTKFRLGSVTKQFTAAAILLLEERGKLSVDDPLGKFIDGVPAAWQAISLPRGAYSSGSRGQCPSTRRAAQRGGAIRPETNWQTNLRGAPGARCLGAAHGLNRTQERLRPCVLA